MTSGVDSASSLPMRSRVRFGRAPTRARRSIPGGLVALRRGVALVGVVAGVFAGGPRTASACSPPLCEYTDRVQSASIATSWFVSDTPGVVISLVSPDVFTLEQTALARVSVTVTADGAMSVPGTLELAPLAAEGLRGETLVLFRFDAGVDLSAAQQLDVTLHVDNTLAVDQDTLCGEDALDVMTSLSNPGWIGNGFFYELGAADEQYVVPSQQLADQVCCDGAYPQLGPCGSDLYWSTGSCVPKLGTTFARTQLTWNSLDRGPSAPHYVVQVQRPTSADPTHAVRTITQWQLTGGVAQLVPDPSSCDELRVFDLFSGASNVVVTHCHDAALFDGLGPTPLDPDAQLLAQCVGTPYTCADDGWMWDSAQCEPYEPAGGGTTTGGMTTGGMTTGGDTGTTGTGTTGITTTGDTGTGDTGTGDTGTGTDGTGAGQDGVSRGCACTASPGEGVPGWLGLCLLALPAWRGSRRRAAVAIPACDE